MSPRRDRLRRVADLARSAGSTRELEAVLTELTSAVVALRPGIGCVMRLVDKAARVYRLAGTGGATSDWRMPAVPFGAGLTHVVAATRQPLLVTDVFKDGRSVGNPYAPKGLTVYYGVPVEAGEDLMGVLNVYFPAGAPPTADEREVIDLFADQAAVAINNARLFAESEARRREAEALAEVGRLLSQSLDPDVVGQRIVDSVRARLGAQFSVLYRLEPRSGDLVVVVTSGDAGPSFGPDMVLPAGTGIAGLAVRERKPQVTRDVFSDPRIAFPPEIRTRVEQARYRAALTVPLVVQDRVIGVLGIGDTEGRIFDDAAIRLGQLFGDQAAIALENARLYAEATRRQREAEELAQVARTLTESLDVGAVGQRIVETVLPLFGAQLSGLRLLQSDGSLRAVASGGSEGRWFEVGHSLRPGEGTARKALVEGKPVWFRDVLNDPGIVITDDLRRRYATAGFQSMLAVPLRVKNTIIGTLAIGHKEPRDYSEREVALLQAFADQAALALDNARLYEDARLRDRAIAAVAEGIVITDVTRPDHPIVYANPGFEQITGYTADEVIGRNCRFLQGADTDPAAVAGLRTAIAAARPCSLEILNYRKDGTPFWNALSISPIHDGHRRVTQFVGVQTDVTDRKRLEEQLRQSQKIEAVGRLAGGIAHDFNNLLTVITSRAEIALEAFAPDDPRRKSLELIGKTADRGADLVRQLLAFSRRQVLQPKVLDLNAIVPATSTMLRRLIGEDIDLVIVLAPSLGRIKVDPGQIDQVIVNLAVNARDAMPEGGKLTIETANIELDESYARRHVGVEPGPYVMLAVSDTGAGMDADTRAHMFEPFFTTKGVGRGTGLGLATVHGIVTQSGGHIGVESSPGRGTTFKMYLPSVDDPAGVADPRPPATAVPGGVETILLVEDEEEVRTLAQYVLTRAGYTVLSASDGVEALRVSEEHRGPLHLLVTDVIMPRMGGFELAQRLAATRAGLKILYMSGYTDSALLHREALPPGIAYLQKPFRPQALARKVREVLDA